MFLFFIFSQLLKPKFGSNWSLILEMARYKIFQAGTDHCPQRPAHNRPWIEDIYSFSNRPTRGPLNNWQTCLSLPLEAKHLPWLFCLQRQNMCWDYFAFCGTWLIEVVMTCDKRNLQSYMLLQLRPKPKTPKAMLQSERSFTLSRNRVHPTRSL